MGKLLINGRPLDECSPAMIVEAAVDPARRAYDLGDRDDFYRNCSILDAFGDAEIATTDELLERFHAAESDRTFRLEFDALRLGEALQFGIKHGIVERVGARPTQNWKLLHRERQFECIGPAKKQHAIRVRGLPGVEAVIAARLWTRELKRRERAWRKELEKYRPSVLTSLDIICSRAPDADLPEYLARLAVGEQRSISACRQLIIDEMESPGSSPDLIASVLSRVARSLPPEPPKPSAEALAFSRTCTSDADRRRPTPPPPPRRGHLRGHRRRCGHQCRRNGLPGWA